MSRLRPNSVDVSGLLGEGATPPTSRRGASIVAESQRGQSSPGRLETNVSTLMVSRSFLRSSCGAAALHVATHWLWLQTEPGGGP